MPQPPRASAAVSLAAALVASAGTVAADPAAGVDTALFRQSYDTGGVFTLEGARLMPLHDLSWKVLTSYAKSPLDVSVPGIGAMPGDEDADSVLQYLVTIDTAFAMTVHKRLEVALDVAAYRTSTGEGYGERGRYVPGQRAMSTGVQTLRPVSNIDPSGGYAPDGLAGPLDVRLGAKVAILDGKKLAVTAVLTGSLPFGEDEMLLGDAGYMVEPRLAIDYRLDRVHATKLVVNAAARIRERTVLEAYDTKNGALSTTDAKVYLDVGSEAVLGVGGVYELTRRALVGLEAVAFVPLPAGASFGSCKTYNEKRCTDLAASDYWGDSKRGDLTLMATIGLMLRLNPHVTATLQTGGGFIGARGDDFRLSLGVVWAPQPAGVGEVGSGDRDRDGIPDVSDGCAEEAEDHDGYQDDDGCPDLDNDSDGITDALDACVDEGEDRDGHEDEDGCPELDNDADGIADTRDRCPDQKEDGDGYQDDDGCPDDDNDGDGFADAADKCPNEPESVNGIEDDDGCPDSRGTGPEERQDRIDLRGGEIDFSGRTATLTAASKVLIQQVARLIKDRNLVIRVEVHVALGTKSTSSSAISAQKKKDKDLSQRRAAAVQDALVAEGVPQNQVQAVGVGADRPLSGTQASDPTNDRVDFIKAQQRSTP
jgi:outer membrane protein OmpA-like peptidoglycan-associated protein